MRPTLSADARHAAASGGLGARFAALGELLAEGVIGLDHLRRVAYVNRAAADLLDVDPELLLGRDLSGALLQLGQGIAAFALDAALPPNARRPLPSPVDFVVHDAEGAPRARWTVSSVPGDAGTLVVIGPPDEAAPARADAPAPALEDALLRRAESETLAHVARELAGAGGDVTAALELLAAGVVSLLGGAEGACVVTLDEGTARVDAAVGTLAPLAGHVLQAMAPPSLLDDVLAGQRVLRTNDAMRDPRVDPRYAVPFGIRHAIVAPLSIEGRVAAVLCAVNAPAGRDGFTEDDAALVQRLADLGALALRNARLYRRAEQSAREAGALSEIARLANQSLEPGRVAALVAEHAARLLGAREARVGILRGGLLVDAGRVGVPAEEPAEYDELFAGEAVRTRRPVRTGDLLATPERWPLSAAAAPAGRANAIAVPLLVGERVIGAIVVAGNEARDFDAHDEELLLAIASHAAIAVENARLYAAAERSARHAGLLADSARALAAEITPAAVYPGVARVARVTLGASGFAVCIADLETRRVEVVHAEGMGAQPQAAATERFWDTPGGRAVSTGRAAFHGGRVGGRLSRAERWPANRAYDDEVRSAALLPLVVEGRTCGVLVLHFPDVREFDAAERGLLSNFGAHVAVAIRNAGLFAAQQRERDQAAAAAAIARVALDSKDLVAGARAILGVLDSVVPTAGKALSLMPPAESTITIIAATGSTEGLQGLVLPVENAVRPEAVGAGDVVVIDDLRALTPEHLAHLAPPERGILVPLRADGRVIGMLAAAWPVDDPPRPELVETLQRLAAHVAVALDVLLLSEEERRRRDLERMLATALATMDQPVFVLAEGRVRYANAAAVSEYGYSMEEFAGLPIAEVVAAAGPSSRPPEEALRDAKRGVWTAEHVHRRKDGSEFPASVSLGHIADASGTAVGQVLSVRNVTEERRIAEQLRQTEKLAAIGELVAGVAHEINNPLTGISALSELLLDDTVDDALGADQRESVRLIKREADRAVAVIRDLLVFSRKTDPRHIPVDLNALVERTLRLRAYSLRAADVEVRLELDPALPPVRGDEQKLQQLFLNLIVNAEQALQDASRRQITVRTRHDQRVVTVSVSDTGVGMPEETRRRVFEPFFSTRPEGVGTGLGLSVSYGIVQAHGGDITVRSAPGRGTTFDVTLPAGE